VIARRRSTPSAPGPHLPLPPADLASHALSLSTLKRGTTLFRSHAVGKGPIWFGPRSGHPAEYRFDAPGGGYGVCYLGRSEMAAFVETFLRDLPVRVVSRVNLELRSISTITLTRSLRVVRVYGAALAKLGATSAVGGAKLVVPAGFAAQPYAHSQAWSLALHDHPAAPDGIQYRSSYDDDLLCVALFGDRAAGAVDVMTIGEPLSGRTQLLGHAIKRYGIRLL
jgi:hypothetical protein